MNTNTIVPMCNVVSTVLVTPKAHLAEFWARVRATATLEDYGVWNDGDMYHVEPMSIIEARPEWEEQDLVVEVFQPQSQHDFMEA